MVNNATSAEEQKDAAKESSVLSRVRMLEAERARARDGIDRTGQNVHPFNRSKAKKSKPGSRRPDSREYTSPERPTRVATKDGKVPRPTSTKNSRDSVETTSPRRANSSRPSSRDYSLGSPLRRDDTVRAFEPAGARKISLKSPQNDARRPSPTKRVNPNGSRGTTADERRALSESPLRQDRKSPTSSRGRPAVEKMSAALSTTAFGDQARRSASLPRRPSDDPRVRGERQPAKNSGVQRREESFAPSAMARSRDPASIKGRPEVAGMYDRTEFQNNKDVGYRTRLSTAARAETLQRQNRDKRNDDEDMASSRRAPELASGPRGGVYTRSTADAAVSTDKLRKLTDGGPNGKSRISASSPKKASVVELSWPKERLEVSHLNKQGSTAYSSSQDDYRISRASLKFHVGESGAAPGDVRLKTQRKHKASELLRNLSAASAVMTEEKASSIGNSSSSGRSSLSQKELGGIAVRALTLSQVRADTQKARCANSPLHKILAAKRTSRISAEEKATKVVKPLKNVPYRYTSAQRLSERLTRAERFTALKKARNKVHSQNGDEKTSPPDSPVTPEKSRHPVFGYSTRPFAVNTQVVADDPSIVQSEPSCVRRSKHLSKVMQQKADHFAAASPSRRSQTTTLNRDFYQETREATKVTDRNQSYVRTLAPQEDQQVQYEQLIQQEVRASRAVRKPEAYRGRQYDSNDIPQVRPLPLLDRANVLPAESRLMPAFGNDQTYPHNHNRFEYPGASGYLSRARGDTNPKRHAPESAFDARRFHTAGDPSIREEALRLQQWRGNGAEVHVGGEEPDELSRIMVAVDRDDMDGSSVDASSSDNMLPLDQRQPPALLRPTAEARGAAQFRAGHAMRHQATTSRAESVLLTDFMEDGPRAADDGQDHTFTGSLNRHDIAQVSSESTGTKPDAFQWLHQKYGTQVPLAADKTKLNLTNDRTQRVKVNTLSQARLFETPKDDEEDDIFFGLEEGCTDDEDGKPRQSARPSRIQTDQLQIEAPQARSVHQEFHQPSANFVPAALKEAADKEDSKNSSKKTNETVLSEKSSTSDIAASLIAEKAWKARYRPNPVDTIMEEPQVGISDERNDDDESLDDETVPEIEVPPTFVLKNLGSVIVNSFHHACTIPGTMSFARN